ncbi:type II toxin-antitoxin system HicB family antitoxin [Serratia ureilytica]
MIVNMSGCAPNSPRCPGWPPRVAARWRVSKSGERNDRRYVGARRNAPQALAEKNFSGKLVLRMTPEQHRRLAIGAMEEGVSLNRYLCARLAG